MNQNNKPPITELEEEKSNKIKLEKKISNLSRFERSYQNTLDDLLLDMIENDTLVKVDYSITDIKLVKIYLIRDGQKRRGILKGFLETPAKVFAIIEVDYGKDNVCTHFETRENLCITNNYFVITRLFDGYENRNNDAQGMRA